jgi:hypothetical protein
MSKLSLKTLDRKHLPYGKFKFIVLLKRESRRMWRCDSNAGQIEQMRGLLRTTCKGKFKLVHDENHRGRRVYTHLYLTEPMDLAMVKLVHADQLHKIYKVNVVPAS